MRSFLFAVALIGAFAALPALAQAPAPAAPPVNVRGKIIKLDGQTLVVKTREGPTVNDRACAGRERARLCAQEAQRHP